jgi:hypothetical protein
VSFCNFKTMYRQSKLESKRGVAQKLKSSSTDSRTPSAHAPDCFGTG